ncbi:MAG: ClpXP protease specificity-enhancing factor [Methylophilales bacterium]|nr:ClpXP protease specificity-enhancing factor [Methylophilales bacterium]
MSEPTSTKPYMIRAIYEWCVDNGLTPHLMVLVDGGTRVPMGFVKDGEIVFNINYSAIKGLQMENDAITFSARFNGVPQNIYIPINAVKGIFARENGQGMFFDPEQSPSPPISGGAPPNPKKKPSLKLVK